MQYIALILIDNGLIGVESMNASLLYAMHLCYGICILKFDDEFELFDGGRFMMGRCYPEAGASCHECEGAHHLPCQEPPSGNY
jgi:hypothetical protein